jgi:hypothetical protein
MRFRQKKIKKNKNKKLPVLLEQGKRPKNVFFCTRDLKHPAEGDLVTSYQRVSTASLRRIKKID